ncbi:MAG: DNA-deoxyinosine glycosylase [Candidatus Dactylopiibacterium carminicum]|nr:MAG: DNA-deoxyinosine glycosylase [Candidatus Dactylopiibacterium carminicum]
MPSSACSGKQPPASVIRSFAPLLGTKARMLILGSMPGQASLRANCYYAHPHNAFWLILGETLGFDPMQPYEQRCRPGIAVWDVLQQCIRPGSLDTDIAPESIVPNDFDGLFARQPSIRWVLFNGAAAETCFRRHVLPGLENRPEFMLLRLPSTSPAHAALRPAQKLAVWREAIRSALAAV